MKILHLKLHLPELLHLANIKTIELNPQSKTQVFLGTNGSGKSVLMHEHSPLAADKNHYSKGGYKYVEIHHKNSLYRLKSSFSDTETYSFIKDEIELNPSLKITNYTELCKIHFGITSDIHALMTGKVNFDQLNVKQRKEWITRISQIDYDYAFSYYKKLVERTRDLQGAIKNLNSKLVIEKTKALKDEEIDELDLRIKILYTEMEKYRNLKCSPKLSVNQLIYAKDNLRKLISDATQKLLNVKNYLYLKDVGIENVRTKEDELLKKEAAVKAMIDYLMKQMDELTNEMSTILEHAKGNEDVLGLEKNSIVEIILQKQQQLKYLKDIEIPDAKGSKELLTSAVSDLDVLLLDMSEYEEGRISQERHSDVKAKEESCKARIDGINSVISVYLKDIDSLSKHEHDDPVKCPQCAYKWNPHFDENVLKDRKEKIESLEGKREVLKKEQNDYREEKEFIERERYLRAQFTKYAEGYPQLRWYWSMYAKHKLLQKPKTASQITYDILSELSVVCEIDKLKESLSHREQLDQITKNNLQQRLKYIEEQIEKINLQAQEQWVIYAQTKEEHEKAKRIIKAYEKYLELKDQIKSHLSVHKDYVEISLSHLTNDHLNACIDILQKEIHVSEQKLLKARNIAHVVKTLEDELISLEDRYDMLKKACDELSPNKGLIAKGLRGFLDHFLPQVNSFIEKVWLYPMKIGVREVGEKGMELDYKFQVQVADGKAAEDISQVSKGMKEMINLAFRLASMPYLGLENGCVFLDEYGANLDAKHKISAYNVTKSLMESENYSQIYIASHFSDGYGELSHADFTVLCPNNVELPNKTCNETTLITYT